MGIWITEISQGRTSARLIVEGQVIGQWAAVLERECRTRLERGMDVTLDLSDVTFIDSGGIETLKRLKVTGLEVARIPQIMEELIEDDPAGFP